VSASSPWRKYKVGRPSDRPNWTELDCCPCTEVSHVSHAEAALRIVGDGKIRKGLVFDHSKLNTERILVTWLSPNYWSSGFRYGNVRFSYDFASLVEGKNYYWVEDITDYNPAACRILVTSEDRSSKLPDYDPTSRDGPWWHDTTKNTHYVNGGYCLEFMFEADLPLRKARQVDFVRHHADYCSVYRTHPKSCSELGLSDGKGGARFLMLAAARGVDLSSLDKTLITEEGKLSYRITNALAWVAHRLHNLTYTAQVTASSATGRAVARAVLNALAIDQRDEAMLLASMFRSEDMLIKALATVFGDCLDWSNTGEIRNAMS
jgi:hypothetical protein